MQHLISYSEPDEHLLRRWETFLRKADFPSDYVTGHIFDDPLILNDKRFAIFAIEEDGAIAAISTGVIDGNRIISGLPTRPQTAFRLDADRIDATNCLASGYAQLAEELAGYVELTSFFPTPQLEKLGFSHSSNEKNEIVVLNLSLSLEEIFKGFSQTRRNELRKAEKSGAAIVSELETENELRALYEIHCDWCSRKSIAPDVYESFRTFKTFEDSRKIFIAKIEGKVIGGSYYRFVEDGVIEYAGNNSLTEFQKHRPNDLIGWHSIKWAHQRGFKSYSMGGAHLFLRRFGGEIVQSHRYTKDFSRFKVNRIKESARDLGIGIYKSIPQSVREKAKALIGKN